MTRPARLDRTARNASGMSATPPTGRPRAPSTAIRVDGRARRRAPSLPVNSVCTPTRAHSASTAIADRWPLGQLTA